MRLEAYERAREVILNIDWADKETKYDDGSDLTNEGEDDEAVTEEEMNSLLSES